MHVLKKEIEYWIRRTPVISTVVIKAFKFFKHLYFIPLLVKIEKEIQILKFQIKTIQDDIAALRIDNSAYAKIKKIYFPKNKRPVVSIIIPVYNEFEYTYQCLLSIMQNSGSIPFEVIIADDASTDYTIHLTRHVKNITVIRNNKNLGFCNNCNNGAKHARGKYIVLLNNDTIVQKNWLENLVGVIANDEKVGIVGPKFIFPDGRLLSAGTILWSDGTNTQYGKFDDPDKPEYNFLRETDYIDGACILVRKNLWDAIGGFDEHFSPCYFEDTDLAFHVRSRGYKIMYQPKTVIIHFENISHDLNTRSSIAEINRYKFLWKWGENLKKHHFKRNEKNTLAARFFYKQKKKILVIDDMVPDVLYSTSYPHMNEILCALAQQYQVTFFPLQFRGRFHSITDSLQNIGVEVFYNADFDAFISSRNNYYDCIVVSKLHNLQFIFKAIHKKMPVIIYDAEAISSLHEVKFWEADENNAMKKNRSFKRQKKFARRADSIITLSPAVKNNLQVEGFKNVHMVGQSISEKKSILPFEKRRDILLPDFFPVSRTYSDEISYCVENIFPRVAEKIGCNFIIAGLQNRNALNDKKNIKIVNNQEDLDICYQQCKLFLFLIMMPDRIHYLYNKATSFGLPSIITEEIANELYGNSETNYLIAKNMDDIISKIIALYTDESLWTNIQKNAIATVSQKSRGEDIVEIISELL